MAAKWIIEDDEDEIIEIFEGIYPKEVIQKAFNFWRLQDFKDACGIHIPKSRLKEQSFLDYLQSVKELKN